MKTIELHHLGDRELWFAKSADNAWSLPMYVDWKHERVTDTYFAMVVPAISLYHSQVLVMGALMAPHSSRIEELNRWLIHGGLPKQFCTRLQELPLPLTTNGQMLPVPRCRHSGRCPGSGCVRMSQGGWWPLRAS